MKRALPSFSALVFIVATATAMATVAVVASTGVAQADARSQARSHYNRGNKAFQRGDYKGAIRQFNAANRLAPSPILSYNIALCHERLGQNAEALRLYRQYLADVPDATNRAMVEESVQRLAAAEKAEADRQADDAAKKRSIAPVPVPVPDEVAPDDATQDPTTDAQDPAPAPARPAIAPPLVYRGSDPELARVFAIDVAKIRDQRGISAPPPIQSSGTPPASGAAPTPPPQGGPPEAQAPPRNEDNTQAGAGLAAQSGVDMDEPPAGAAIPASQSAARKAQKPVYKQWWFWVVLGVGAIVVVSIAADSGKKDEPANFQAYLSPSSTSAVASGGVALLRF